MDFINGGGGSDWAIIWKHGSTLNHAVDASFTTGTGLTLTDGTVVRNVESLSIYSGSGNDFVTNTVNGQAMPAGTWMEAILGPGDDTAHFIGFGADAVGGDGYDTAVLDLSNEQNPISFAYTELGNEAYFVNSYLPEGISDKFFYIEQFENIIVKFGNNGEYISLGPQDDFISSEGGNDELSGGAGSDTLLAGTGDDRVNGGTGRDFLYGGAGDDWYIIDRTDDLIFENSGEGHDQITATDSFYLYANIEDLFLQQDAGDLFGVGNDLTNELIGNYGQHLLIGWGGNDTILGGFGRDAIFGADGDDDLQGEDGIDYVVAGAGNDSIDGGNDADEIYGEDGDDSILGGISFDTDILVGGSGNDTIDGASRQGDFDYLYGNAGNDVFYVDTPADPVFEEVGGGTDTVHARIIGAGYYLYDNIENLVLLDDTPFGVGNGLDNRLTGNNIGNYLLGGAGDDTLDGKGGGDVLFGEGGRDTFVFGFATGGDVIGDFTPGVDRIDVTAFGFTGLAQLQTAFVQNGNTGAINLGGGNFVVLNGVTMSDLGAGDFVL